MLLFSLVHKNSYTLDSMHAAFLTGPLKLLNSGQHEFVQPRLHKLKLINCGKHTIQIRIGAWLDFDAKKLVITLV